MATYDPIIHFYDDPGHPYWPNKNGGSGDGGGGAALGEGYMIDQSGGADYFDLWASDQPMDLSGKAPDGAKFVARIAVNNMRRCMVPAGLYVYVRGQKTIDGVTGAGTDLVLHSNGDASFQMPTNDVTVEFPEDIS